jgi:hypothetical protein
MTLGNMRANGVCHLSARAWYAPGAASSLLTPGQTGRNKHSKRDPKSLQGRVGQRSQEAQSSAATNSRSACTVRPDDIRNLV